MLAFLEPLMWISRSTETKRRHTFRRPNDWTLVPVGWEGRDAVGEWSGAADIPPPWWDSLGRSGNRLPQFSTGTCCCTNKLTPGLCSNGIQTWCSKTKILFWVFFFFCLPSFHPLFPTPPPPSLGWRTLQLKDALQLSQTDLKIFPVPFPSSSVPTQQRCSMTSPCPPRISADLLDFPVLPDIIDLPLSRQTRFLITFTCFPPSPHLLPLLSLATSSTLLLRRGSELILE